MRAGIRVPFEIEPSYNIAPMTYQPIVRLDRDTDERELVPMRWGLVPFWARDANVSYSTINASAETLTMSETYRDAIKHRRCLVPADGFFEWKHSHQVSSCCLCRRNHAGKKRDTCHQEPGCG
jgi:putative SOS response-associated peptidase YedK